MAVVRRTVDPQVEIAAIVERAFIKYPDGDAKRIDFAEREIRRHNNAEQLLAVLVRDGIRAAFGTMQHKHRRDAHWLNESPEVVESNEKAWDRETAKRHEKSPAWLRLVAEHRMAGVLEMMIKCGKSTKPLGDMTRDEVAASKLYYRGTAKTCNTYDKLLSFVEAGMKPGKKPVRDQMKPDAVQKFWEGIRGA